MCREEKGCRWMFCLALIALAVLAGCSAKEPTGSAQVMGMLSQHLDVSSVQRVELTVSGPDMASLTTSLAPSGYRWGGVLRNIPVGEGRSFSAQAFDSDNSVIFIGQADGITITAGQMTAVTLLLQQRDASPPFENASPVITSLVASPESVEPGGEVALQATAEDANAEDTLSYSWTAGAGSFGAPGSRSTVWTAPVTLGAVVLTLTVSDSKGATSVLNFTINVGSGTGSAGVTVSINSWPQVFEITATPSTVNVGETTELLTSVWDADGENLTYHWTAGCPGTWDDNTSDHPFFTPAIQPNAGSTCASCTLTLTVTDGRGGSGTGTLDICVGRKATVRFPPKVIDAFQSVASASGEGDTVGFRVRATDGEDDALFFSWTTNIGTLDDVGSSANMSEVLWSAPDCVSDGVLPTITSTVSNSANLVTTTTFTVTGMLPCDGPRWVPTGSLIRARELHASILLPSGKVLVTGGAYTNTAEVFDPELGAWASTASMAEDRSRHTATLLPSGKVLIAGGHSSMYSRATAELYDPDTGTWSSTGSMTESRAFHTATLLPSGRVLVVGGFDLYTVTLPTTELYDAATGTWASTGSMVQGRIGHTATLLQSGKVLVVGGSRRDGTTFPTAEVYDPLTGAWTSTGSLAMPRSRHTATLLPSGKVLVVGGDPGDYVSSTTAEVYDPTTGTWAPTGSLVTVRNGHTATLLPSGKVLVVGDLNGSRITELYDPATGDWSPTWRITDARGLHTATLLNSGELLVVGGFYSPHGLTTAELYLP